MLLQHIPAAGFAVGLADGALGFLAFELGHQQLFSGFFNLRARQAAVTRLLVRLFELIADVAPREVLAFTPVENREALAS